MKFDVMLASIKQYQQYLMIGVIATATLSLIIKLFSRGKPRINKLRKKGYRRIRLFFNYPHIEKFKINTVKTETPEFDTENKFEKMKYFLENSEEKKEKFVFGKQDQIFFKLLKNFSTIYNEQDCKNTKRRKIKNMKLIENKITITSN